MTLIIPDRAWRPIHPGQTVALATLVEYAVAAYGRERPPVLVAGLGRYDTWESLLPAVYGASLQVTATFIPHSIGGWMHIRVQ